MIDSIGFFWCYTFLVSLAGIFFGWWMRGSEVRILKRYVETKNRNLKDLDDVLQDRNAMLRKYRNKLKAVREAVATFPETAEAPSTEEGNTE